MNLIIIAVILLIVAFIIIAIFTGAMGDFISGATDCEKKGYVCKESCGEGEIELTLGAKCPEGEVCCIPK